MSSAEYKQLCRVSDLNEKEGKRFFVNDTEVALFKVDGEVYALSNRCPHQQSAMIYEGYIEEGCVVCPIHGWMFNLKTGKMPTGNSGLQSYPVLVKDGYVYVDVVKKEWNW